MSVESQIAELEKKISEITSNPRYLQSKRARNITERNRFDRYTRELTVLNNKLQALTPVTKTALQVTHDAQKPHHKPAPKAEAPVSNKKPSWRNQPKKIAWRNQGEGLVARNDDIRDEDWERAYAEKFGDPKKTGDVKLPESAAAHRVRTGRSTLTDPSLARTVPVERKPLTRNDVLEAKRVRAIKQAREKIAVEERKRVGMEVSKNMPPPAPVVTRSTPGAPLVTEPKAQPAQKRMRGGRRAVRPKPAPKPKPNPKPVIRKPAPAPKPSFGTENLDELESLDSIGSLEDLDNMDSFETAAAPSNAQDDDDDPDAESFSFSEE